MFSVFSFQFQQNKFYPNGPLVLVVFLVLEAQLLWP